MSNIAKQKANQWILKHKDGDVLYVQDAYIAAYDQAMQDFMEKACEWLEPTFKRIAGYYCGGDLMNDFENYIKDESN